MTTLRYFALTGCLFALAVVAGSLIAGRYQAPPLRPGRHLVVPTGPMDMGFIAPDSIVRFHFPVRNLGTADLRIKKVFASCGCTVAKISRTTLAPEASALVSVAFHSAGYWRGVHKEIYFVSNDSSRPFQQLSLFGYVRVGIRLDVKSVNLGTGEFEQRLRPKVIHVLADAGMPVGDPRFAGDDRGLTVQAGPWRTIDSGEMQQCSLRVGTGPLESQPGSYTRRVILEVGAKIRLPLRVLYTVEPVVSSRPAEIPLDGEDNASATAILDFDGHHIRIDSMKSLFGYCTARSIGVPPDGTEIRITRQRSAGELAGGAIDILRVRYRLDHGARRETLSIPVVLANRVGRKTR